MFRPRRIGEFRFFDGGAASPTHAHLALEVQPDLVIISSPLTRPSHRPMALLARRRLNAELAALSDGGIPTLVIEPPAEANGLFRGFPRRDRERAEHITELARSATRMSPEDRPPINTAARGSEEPQDSPARAAG